MTQYNILEMPLRRGHYKVLAVASLGQFLGSLLATVVGVMIPLMEIGRHPEFSAFQQGLTGCIELVGIMLGSLLFGRLSDRYGYLFFYRFCPALVCMASVLAFIFNAWGAVIIFLFIMGFGIGGEYSLDSDYISELMPARWKQFMVGVAKASSALGNILGALACWLLIAHWREPEVWPRLMLIVTAVTIIMILLRIRAHESPLWLMGKGETQKAEATVKEILGPDVYIPTDTKPATKDSNAGASQPDQKGEGMLQGKNLLRAIYCGIPWACEGLGVYGIGVFLPMLCIALGFEHGLGAHASVLEQVDKVINSVEVTTVINCFILPGFVAGLLLVRRMSHARMQTLGFGGAALGLVLLLVSYTHHWSAWISLIGFCFFELALNAGPHLITFILPSEIYPVENRAQGAGLAASIGKLGAVLGVFFIPMLLHAGGAELVLWVSIGVMIAGGAITAILAPLVSKN